ncbi:TATA-binding protein-associated factor mot1 [Elasticomyces elasticus]|nr:TATA-binding protein-associated factor mot1 [Elasticomyces elasticus]
MTASRLDRLVVLLETGSTQLIRNTAAQQLADVQKNHPDELFNLLARIVPYLRSRSWDTRTAAAKAIGGIVDHTEKFDPNALDPPAIKSETNGHANGMENATHPPASEDQLQLDTLAVDSILTHGKALVASSGKQYDYQSASLDAGQRLAQQKKTLVKRLGLGGEYIEEDLVTEKDIAVRGAFSTPGLSKLETSRSRENSISGAGDSSPLDTSAQRPLGARSKRQLNALKRKQKEEAKFMSKRVKMDFGPQRRDSTSVSHVPTKGDGFSVKTELSGEQTPGKTPDYFTLDRKGDDDDTKVVSEYKGLPVPDKSAFQSEDEEENNEWPFDRLCEFLTIDLFDTEWEVRHGAAMGLREIIRVHGAGAGQRVGKSRAENSELNRAWLDDLACRLCCVLMLDRFADYVGDIAVAPIRETAGQTLGAVLQYLPSQSVYAVNRILYRLVMQKDLTGSKQHIWHACHAGMIGMRYLVAVRNDLLVQDHRLMNGVLECVIKGLEQTDDDVRACSAATLIPVAKEFVNSPPAVLSHLIGVVWACLSDLSDDLSASTGSVMDLLAKLCSFPEILEAMKRSAAQDADLSFNKLVPRLYPFLRHTITTVRSAVLRALLTFLGIEEPAAKDWVDGKALRLLYQNLLVERNEGVLKLSLQVWLALAEVLASQGRFAVEFEPHVAPLVALTIHPIGVTRHPIPMDPTLFIRPSGHTYPSTANNARRVSSPTNGSEGPNRKRRKSEKKEQEVLSQSASSHNIDAPVMQGDIDLVGADVFIRSKTHCAHALGKAMALWPASSQMDVFGVKLVPHIRSPYSSTQLFTLIVIEEYARALTSKDEFANTFAAQILPVVEESRPPAYSDLTSYLQVVRAQCQVVLNTFRDNLSSMSYSKIPSIAVVVQGEPEAGKNAFSLADAVSIVGAEFDRIKKTMSPNQRVTSAESLNTAKFDAEFAIREAREIKEQCDVRIRAAAAAALVALHEVKKTAIIKPIMESVKLEENAELQKRSAAAVASLVAQYVDSGKSKVSDKVVINLVKFCCMETAETPEFHINASKESGMLSLQKDEDIQDHPDPAAREREAKQARTTRRGAKEALEQLCRDFGGQLFEKVPKLKTLMEEPVQHVFGGEPPSDITDPDNTAGQEAIDAMSTIRAFVPTFHPDLHPFVLGLLPLVAKALQSRLAVLRYAAAKCFASICSVISVSGFTMLVERVLPAVNNPTDVHCRQGAIECVYHLIHVMEDGILPYVIFLLVPVLGRMSDSDTGVRLIATTAFATLVKLVPLEAGIPDPPGLSEELLKGRERERKFIAQMLDPKKVEPFPIPVAIKAELRSYQQDGVNWLAFLNRYHLHGILCDDMGLGKTLQTLCIVASDHHMRAEEFSKTQAPDARRLPSLIVCPPTLSGHWQQEIRTYAPFLKAVAYVGPPSVRGTFRSLLTSADVVITSYDVCRNDVDILEPINWNYCVLDEGHLIKNPKAKISQAVKRLGSNHRLILSGTPIQNNVLELWSLFDFLMPGFLGTEKVFQDRFAKPIAASRFSKSSSKEQERGALAIEALHKQVLPFLLRRLKEEVLDDLPPKILQNYYCDLSDLQKKLFEDFSKKEGKALAEKATSGDKEAKQHIFQALQYMRKLCNSPALVMKKGHKHYEATQAYLKRQNTNLNDPVHAPKLTALRDLLVDCGIGVPASNPGDIPTADQAVSQHRALIFCQMKEMLDMVESTVLKEMLPTATFSRLDGSIEASKRQDIVNRFNSDPSIDCLLLTTSVGGLGLNLTGADTVIFVEHDWNPQKDLQAMDRAHRIGQKKVVNVYRLITRGTLEEKILNLQRFKIDIASTVVNQQNAGLGTMETDQILDLFSLGETDQNMLDSSSSNRDTNGNEVDMVDAEGNVREKGKKGFLDELGELWDETQYEEEYNLDSFLATMKV